ncbi:MAG: hypothetical protein H7067_01595 [Burkholderiales bacterium]|nr:hypothetical protein [Opitutaceae bacterium]
MSEPSSPTPSSDPAAPSASCPYCLAVIGPDEASDTCPECRAPHHNECWTENGGCAVYGCACVPVVESRAAIEVPMSYWGQEHKPCPACGHEILAAAVRCRNCGTTFASARPEDTAAFQSRSAMEARLPAARRSIILIFILSVVPFLAPVGVVWALLWGRDNREEIEALPPLYGALRKIGLYTGSALTLTLVVIALLYSNFQKNG